MGFLRKLFRECFREIKLLLEIKERLGILMATVADLQTAIDDLNATVALVVEKLGAGGTDLAPQVDAINAAIAKLKAALNPVVVPPPAGTLVSTAPSVALTLAVPTSSFTVSESDHTASTFSVVSSDLAVATIAPASSTDGNFVITRVGTGNATISVTDATGKTLSIPVT